MSKSDGFSFPNHYTLGVRLRNFMFRKYSALYLSHHDRDGFLAHKKVIIIAELLPVVIDAYQNSIVQIWQRGYFDKQPLATTLSQIEKCRQEFLLKQYAANEFPSLYGHDRVDDFVEVSDPLEIIHFLIKNAVLSYWLSVVIELQNNRQRGGLRDVTEAAILAKAKNGERIIQTNYGAQVGLKWTGSKVPQRIDGLYRHFVQHGFIPKQTKPEDFKNLFSDQPIDSRVTWLKTSKELLLFIFAFIDGDFLWLPKDLKKKHIRAKELFVSRMRGKITADEDSELKGALREVNLWLYPRIAACFKNKKGIPFNSSKLKHARNDLQNKLLQPKSPDEFSKLADNIAHI